MLFLPETSIALLVLGTTEGLFRLGTEQGLLLLGTAQGVLLGFLIWGPLQALPLMKKIRVPALVLICVGSLLACLHPLYLKPFSYLISLGLSGVLNGVGYIKLREAGVFAGRNVPSVPVRYARSTLRPAHAEKQLGRLLQHMKEAQPFLHPDLTLPGLAQDLGLPVHHLSQLINEHLGLSFPVFINRYRVDAAKHQLTDPACAHLTILAIAYDAGFSAKSTFYTAFKKHTGLTPTQFKHRA